MIVRYDVFAYGTAYSTSSTKSKDPGGSFFRAFPGGAPQLKVTFKASDHANEQKLLKIDYEDRRTRQVTLLASLTTTIVRLWAWSRSTKVGWQLKFIEAAQFTKDSSSNR